VLPGVRDYLRGAAELGLKIGLASSSSGDHVRGHLERLELLHYFQATRCFEDTSLHKPDPAPYRAVLEDLGVGAEEAVAFEDSPNGVTSARAAGIFCVAVPNPITCQLPLDHADHLVASLAEVPLEQILARAEGGRRCAGGDRLQLSRPGAGRAPRGDDLRRRLDRRCGGLSGCGVAGRL